MTSKRQILANRPNARLSTGPRTVSGKATAARNALRHGLAVAIPADPALSGAVEELARRIAGADVEAEVVECARRVAEAEIELRRVRSLRARLFEPISEGEAGAPATTGFYSEAVEPSHDEQSRAAAKASTGEDAIPT